MDSRSIARFCKAELLSAASTGPGYSLHSDALVPDQVCIGEGGGEGLLWLCDLLLSPRVYVHLCGVMVRGCVCRREPVIAERA